MSKSGFSLNDNKSKFSMIMEPRVKDTNFKPILIGEAFRKWMELSSLSEEKLIMLLQEMNNFDEINYFFMNNYQNKIGVFVKLIWKVLMRCKSWSDSKGQHSMNFREEDWSKIKTLSLNSRPEFRNHRMKLIVWTIREILKMLKQYAVDYPTFPVNLRYSHFEILAECWAVLCECRAATISRQTVWDTRGISGKVFVNPTASSSSLYPGGFNPWSSNASEHTSPHVTSKRQTPDTTLDPRCHSEPWARNSFDPCEERISKNYGADQQRLQISDLHFGKFPNPATFASWKIRFKIEVRTCSQYPTEAMLWIKEVEMAESVDDLKSSRSVMDQILRYSTRKLLRHWTESSRIPASRKRSVWRTWKLKKKTTSFEEDRSLTWCTSTSVSLGPTILSRTITTYLQLFFEMTIFRDSIRNGNQKKVGPDHHRFKTMAKRTVEQILRMKTFLRQKRKLLDKRRGQESGDKTAWTKNSWRLLAVESQRAVFQRWQLQFPSRYH